MCRPQRLECKNPRRNAAVYHSLGLGLFRDWIVQNAVFRCSRYVALPAIIPHGRGDGERFIHVCYGDVGYSVSRTEYFASSSSEFSFTPKVSGVIVAQVWAYETFPAYGGQIRIHIATPAGLRSVAEISTGMVGNDRVMRMVTAKAVFAGVEAGKTYHFKPYNDPDAGFGQSTPYSWLLEVRHY